VSKEVLALGLTVLVHIIGMAALVWALLLDEENRPDWRSFWPGDDDGDDRPPEPNPDPAGGGLPLPDAMQSAVRMREPARLRDALGRPARRPAHPPERVPERTGPPSGSAGSPS
jgi:hypothetical protein